MQHHLNCIVWFQSSAQQAQANAAEAAAKAAAAGLGGHKDASYEGTAYEEYKVAPPQQQQQSQEDSSVEYYPLQSDYQH